MPDQPGAKTEAPVPVRRISVGVVVSCSAFALGGLALLALGVARRSLTITAASAVIAVAVAAAVVIALVSGRGRVRLKAPMWEMFLPLVVVGLVTEWLLGAIAGLGAALLYTVSVIGLRLVAPLSWLRAETYPWMRSAGADRDAPLVAQTRESEEAGAMGQITSQATSRPRRRHREEETAGIIPRAEGSHRDVSVALIDVPVFRAESGRLRLRDVDATVAMLDAVEDWLPRAATPASRRKPWHCPICVPAQPLDASQAQPVAHELEVRPREGPPFVLEVTIPSVTCPGCGRTLALFDEERASSLREAIIAALDSAGIHRK